MLNFQDGSEANVRMRLREHGIPFPHHARHVIKANDARRTIRSQIAAVMWRGNFVCDVGGQFGVKQANMVLCARNGPCQQCSVVIGDLRSHASGCNIMQHAPEGTQKPPILAIVGVRPPPGTNKKWLTGDAHLRMRFLCAKFEFVWVILRAWMQLHHNPASRVL
jgi:hypothetical protein